MSIVPESNRTEEHQWKSDIAENIDKGESIYSVYKGEALQRLTGRMTDTEALALGHFDGITNITLSSIIATETGLNKFSTLERDYVPMVKRVKKSEVKETDIIHSIKSHVKIWITDEQEAIKLGKQEQLDVVDIEGKYYFVYPGLKTEDYLMTEFAYNIARASGSLRGETKKEGLGAVSNIRNVPVFPQMQSMRPMGEVYGDDYKDKDAD